MTIIEAIKSGKRFSLKGDPQWYKWNPSEGFSMDLILRDDWEIEEESVTVTRSQAVEAAAALMKGMSIRGQRPDTSSFLKALGFKE